MEKKCTHQKHMLSKSIPETKKQSWPQVMTIFKNQCWTLSNLKTSSDQLFGDNTT